MGFQFSQLLGGLFSGFTETLTQNLTFLVFGRIFYTIFIAVSYLIIFAQLLFNMMAGIEAIKIGDFSYGGYKDNGDPNDELILGLVKQEGVQTAFWTIVGVCLVLLVVFTIVAVIKAEFAMQSKSKSPIISRALMSFANFLIIPIMFIVGVYATGGLVRVIDKSLKRDPSTIAYKCFQIGAADANRARLDSKFANYLIGQDWILGDTDSPFKDMTNEQVAETIDNCFANINKESEILTGEPDEDDKNHYSDAIIFAQFTNTTRNNRVNENKYADWHAVSGYPDLKNNGLSYLNPVTVNYFYDFSSFNFILGIGSGAVIAWSMLGVTLLLVKRILEMLLLFLFAPIMTAVAPLDGGKAEKTVRTEFMKRLLSVIGPVFVYNLFFMILEIFTNIVPFSGEGGIGLMASVQKLLGPLVFRLFNMMFQVVVLLVSLNLLKTANSMFTSMLGIDDLVSKSDSTLKSGMNSMKTITRGVTGVVGGAAALAVKGTAAAAKGVKGGYGAIKGLTGAERGLGEAGMDYAKALTADSREERLEKQLAKEEKNPQQNAKQIDRIKNELSKVGKVKETDTYKKMKAKQNLEAIEGWNTSDEVKDNARAKEWATIEDISSKHTATRKVNRQQYVGGKWGDIKETARSGYDNVKESAKTSLGTMQKMFFPNFSDAKDRLKDSLLALANDSGKMGLNFLFNKEERMSYAMTPDQIKKTTKKDEKNEEKEKEFGFMKKVAARQNGDEAYNDYSEKLKAYEQAKKDGVSAEIARAKRELENSETRNNITREAKIMQAVINNPKDPRYEGVMKDLKNVLQEARDQAKKEGESNFAKEIEKQTMAQTSASQGAMKGLEEKMDNVAKGIESMVDLFRRSSSNSDREKQKEKDKKEEEK